MVMGLYNIAISRVSTKLLFACILVMGILFIAPKAYAVDNVIVHYDFEDNLLDSSGNENNGAIGGNVTYVDSGHSGKAISLNDDGWVVLPDSTLLNNTTFTISLWFKTSGNGALFGYQQAPVGQTANSSVGPHVPVLSVDNDGRLFSDMYTSSGHIYVRSANIVNDNQWHRVVMTSGTSSIRVYLDGTDIGGASGTPIHLTMSKNQIGVNLNSDVGITWLPYSQWNYYTGLIDDFTFYTTAQTAEEIAKTTQSISFDSIPDKTTSDPSFDLNATATSGLDVTYASSNTTVATVSGKTVTIHGIGTTSITASQAGDATYSFAPQVVRTLTVTAPPSFVAVTNITGVPATATAGVDLTLAGTVSPAGATNQTIVWSMNDPGDTGASLNDNVLSTTAAGTVSIRATISNGATQTTDYTKDFVITVSNAPGPVTHTITASAGSGGSISPSGTVSVVEGGSQAFTITPQSNYRIETVSVDGVDQGRISSYTFSNVTAIHTIYAAFSYVGDTSSTRTLTDSATGVTVSGNSMQAGTRLAVVPLSPQSSGSDAASSAVRRAVESGSFICGYRIDTVKGRISAPLRITIPVSSSHNGESVSVSYSADDRLFTVPAEVKNGAVTFYAESLPSFVILEGLYMPDSEVSDPPKTGDERASFGFVMIGFAALCAGYMKRRKA